MADNPLMDRPVRHGRVTTDMLNDLADSLNRERFVQHMGRHYHVALDEHGKHYLSWSNVRAQ